MLYRVFHHTKHETTVSDFDLMADAEAAVNDMLSEKGGRADIYQLMREVYAQEELASIAPRPVYIEAQFAAAM